MTFDDLKFFFEIAHCGSFSKAAENLNITQPNLTKHIARLEQEIGIRLFDRSTHHCRITQDGALFLHRTEDLFFQLRSSIEDTRMRSKNPYTLTYIGTTAGESPTPPILELLRRINTGEGKQRYILQGDTYPNMIDKLRAHEYDMIISADRNARNISDFEFVKLEPMKLMLAVHRSHPKAANPDLTPRDCTDEIVFLSLPDGKNAPPSRIGDFSRRAGAPLNLTILPSPADLIENIRLGSGVAIIPSTVDPARYPDIAFYKYEEERPNMYQALLWRKDETSPQVLNFVRMVREVLVSEGVN